MEACEKNKFVHKRASGPLKGENGGFLPGAGA
jgi:hypothetical protein